MRAQVSPSPTLHAATVACPSHSRPSVVCELDRILRGCALDRDVKTLQRRKTRRVNDGCQIQESCRTVHVSLDANVLESRECAVREEGVNGVPGGAGSHD